MRLPSSKLCCTRKHPSPLLHVACGSDKGNATGKLLIDSNAGIEPSDPHCETLFRLACLHGLDDVATALAGTSGSNVVGLTASDDLDTGGFSLLAWACLNNRVDIAKLIISSSGKNVNDINTHHVAGFSLGDNVKVKPYSDAFVQAFIDTPEVDTKQWTFAGWKSASRRSGTISEGGRTVTGGGDW